MLNTIKEMVMNKGMALFQSGALTKLMESERFGQVIEKAMSLPFKVSTAVTAQKVRVVSLFDLATQEDLDELRRSMSRIEGVLKQIKTDSKELLKKVDSKDGDSRKVVE